ncbi:MAG: hypothetical protein ACRCVW_01580 [Brevinema sp.]
MRIITPVFIFISMITVVQLFAQESTENYQSPTPSDSSFGEINTSKPADSVTFDPIPSLPSGNRQTQSLESFTNTTKTRKKRRYYAGFKFGGQYGQFETIPYSDVIFTPYMQLGPLFLGYEVPLRFNWRTSFISSLWTSPAAAISKIEMSLYFSKTNSIFKYIQAEITTKQQIYQGHGRFFYNYNANQYGPYEPSKSFVFGLDTSYFGINYSLANIASPTLMAGEIFFRPIAGIKNKQYSFYKNFKLYAVLGVDLSAFHGHHIQLYDYASADNQKNSPTFSMIEAGMDIPLFEVSNKFNLLLYADYSYIFEDSKNNLVIPSASGISYGLLMKIYQIFPIRFEMSHAFGNWQPRWVDKFYNIDRVYLANQNCFKPNKVLSTIPDLIYYNASFGIEWIKKAVFINLEVFGDTGMNDFGVTMSLSLGKELLKLFSADIAFTIRGLTEGAGLIINQNTFVFELDLKYHMLPNMYWGMQWQYSGLIGNVFRGPNTVKLDTKPFHFIGLNFSFQY